MNGNLSWMLRKCKSINIKILLMSKNLQILQMNGNLVGLDAEKVQEKKYQDIAKY